MCKFDWQRAFTTFPLFAHGRSDGLEWAGDATEDRMDTGRHLNKLMIDFTPRMRHQCNFAKMDSYSASVSEHAASVVSSNSTFTNSLSNSSIASISFSAVASDM